MRLAMRSEWLLTSSYVVCLFSGWQKKEYA